MAIPKEYAIFPRELIKEGVTFLVHVHVYLPTNQSMLLFRKPGNTVEAEDLDSFDKIPADRLLYPISENPRLNEMRAKVLALDLQKGEVSSPSVKAAAAGLLESMTPEANLAETMNQAAEMVKNLVKNFKKSAATSAYDEALKRTAAQPGNPLAVHHSQVSTIAVLMALTVGDFSMDDLSDLATAGLIHDLGLREIAQCLSDSHFKGIRKFENQEKIIYMRHVGLTLDQIKKEKIPVTPGVTRIIEHHHENWDGSGFKNCMGTKIYRAARILRIADDLVSFVQESANQRSFQQAMVQLRQEIGVYDPEMMNALLKA